MELREKYFLDKQTLTSMINTNESFPFKCSNLRQFVECLKLLEGRAFYIWTWAIESQNSNCNWNDANATIFLPSGILQSALQSTSCNVTETWFWSCQFLIDVATEILKQSVDLLFHTEKSHLPCHLYLLFRIDLSIIDCFQRASQCL